MYPLDIGFPNVSDEYRVKGNRYYPEKTYIIDKSKLIGLSPNDEFYKGWMDYNRKMALERINNIEQSKIRSLLPPYTQKNKSGAKGQVMIGVHQDDMQLIREKNKLSGSGLNLPDSDAGIGMNAGQEEKYRQKIIDTLRKNIQPSGPQEMQQIQQMQPIQQSPEVRGLMMNKEQDQKQEFDLLLASVMENIENGIINANVYNNLLKISSYLVSNIWKINNIDTFKELISVMNTLKLEILNLRSSYINNELGRHYSKENIQYATSVYDLINRLYEYILENINGIGKDEQQRKTLAKSSIRSLKSTIALKQERQARNQREQNPLPTDLGEIGEFPTPQQPEIGQYTENLYRTGTGKRRHKPKGRLANLY